jgi:glycosyltransferase involved in cell wall biosynthesis
MSVLLQEKQKPEGSSEELTSRQNPILAKMKKEFANRRIAIFEPRGDITTNPSLMCLIEALNRGGAKTDVMMPTDRHYHSLAGLANRYPFPKDFCVWEESIHKSLVSLKERFQLLRLNRLFDSGAYDVILGVNSGGLIKGYEYARRYGIPLVYISFELFFRDELSSPKDVLEKERELTASQYADLIIIQDELRAELLAAENRLGKDNFVYLPVSPSSFPVPHDSDYWRKRFGIIPEQRIVLHSGSFREWTYAQELIENVGSWPDRFCLVIHTRYRPKKTDKYIRAALEYGLPRIFVSTEPLRAQEYDELVASADIGLVLYKNVSHLRYTQRNIQNIGLSSGKFSYYMKCGVPVISIGQGYYEKLLLDYDFGRTINDLGEMPAALERVDSSLAHYSAEARRLFSEKLDFDIYWPTVSKRLLGVLR